MPKESSDNQKTALAESVENCKTRRVSQFYTFDQKLTKFGLGAKRLGKQLQNSTSIWPKNRFGRQRNHRTTRNQNWFLAAYTVPGSLRLATTRLWRGLFAPMDKRGKNGCTKNRYSRLVSCPKPVKKATRKTLITTKFLNLKGFRGTRGRRSCCGIYVLQESVFWVWFLHSFLHVSG